VFLGYFAGDSETRYLKTGTGTVTSTNILDGTIVDADIDASAAIAGTKISPDFGSQNVVTTGDVQSTSINGGPLAGMRNAIINGNFDIWQRGTSFTGNEYGADRWRSSRAGSTYTATQESFTLGQTDVPNEPEYYLRIVVSSVVGADNFVQHQQRIEDVRTFAGQQVTLSFWAKADASKNIAVGFTQGFGDGGSPSDSVLEIGVTKVALTTSWQKITVTTTIPSISGKTLGTDKNSSLRSLIWLDAGSNFDSRTDSLGQQSGTFDIAQVQLEAGPVATPFERRPIGTELALCQRYHFRIGGSQTGGIGNKYSDAAANNMFNGSVTFPSQMRAVPNLTWDSPIFTNSTEGDHPVSNSGATLRANATAAGTYRIFGGTLIFDAEL
jgi:hypothetical protein